ncbi:MAG TPA: 16S rRNA (cytidine(1402)-2'-O)-methyltransferase [Gemmatimonadaceae bacterium]|nr:16S rRNA (cytidine(1402)-2'-O)-methyltransferase [Gemmatimonadaceae bacterium]
MPLYIVSTPIGNLSDLSARALDTLRSAALVLAEDTRHTRHLLQHFGITTPLQSVHEHNEARVSPALVERLCAGETFALVSDAGTPLLSDPGARLVRAAIDAGVPVLAVPGASALLAALVVSGIGAERFTFEGFLPRRGSARAAALRAVVESPITVVLYEAPGRVAGTLAELAAAGAAERQAAVARELTKQFEETRRGTVAELAEYYANGPPRGEVVVVIAGAPPTPLSASEETLRERARAWRAEGMTPRDVARRLAGEMNAPRNVAYRLAHEE